MQTLKRWSRSNQQTDGRGRSALKKRLTHNTLTFRLAPNVRADGGHTLKVNTYGGVRMRGWFRLLPAIFFAASCAQVFAVRPPMNTIIITQNQSVANGSALFVAVDRPELNSLTTTGAIKMWNSGNNNWVGRFALPANEADSSVGYRLFTRTTSSSTYRNTGNGTIPQSGPTANLAKWNPGYTGKTVYALSTWTNVTVYYNQGNDVWGHSPVMTRLGQGRNGNESKYVVTGIGVAGKTLEFVLHGYANNVEQWGNPSQGGIGNNYVTPLDQLFIQDGMVFNYEPPSTVSQPSVSSVNSWSSSYTNNGIPTRGGRVYLPRGYTQNTTKRYPVLYMHDGQNVFDPGGDFGSWSADPAATAEIAGGRMRETIIVAINNTGSRMSEYGTPQDGYTGNYYLLYIKNNIMPSINGTYRTLTNRMDTGNMGSSLGGLIAAYQGLSTNVFGLIGAVSPSYWYGPTFTQWINSQPTKGKRIWQYAGDNESDSQMWNPFWQTYDYYMADGYVIGDDMKIAVGFNQGHNEAAWKLQLPESFRYLYNILDESGGLYTSAPPVSAGTVQFANSSYSVGEGAGSVRIYVTRTGGSDGAASVAYATANGTAIAGSDYTAASGTLNWANGDSAQKFFDVTILDDASYEGNETFSVNLSGATVASLGSPASATVTITDNDPAPPELVITNPATALIVDEHTETYDIQGTANAANWTNLKWTNSLTGDSGSQPITAAWTLTAVPVGVGTNEVVVSASKILPAILTNAFDSATDPAYPDGAWADQSNGGFGFGAWNLSNVSGSSGHFTDAAAWGMWSHEGGYMAEAIRPFSSALTTGETFSVLMRNNWIWEEGGSVGVALRSSGVTVWELFFNGGDLNYNVATGVTDIGWTSNGLNVAFTLTSSSSYSVDITPVGGAKRTYTGTFAGSIDNFRAWSYQNGTGDTNNQQRNFYINNLKVVAQGGGESSISETAVLIRPASEEPEPTEHDGIPMEWWNRYELGTNSTAVADEDDDGASNWEEYIADTDPTNGSSYYPNMIINADGAGVLQLQAGPPTTNSRVYDAWFTDDIVNGTWTPLDATVPGAGDGSAVFLSVTNATTEGFYRTGVRIP